MPTYLQASDCGIVARLGSDRNRSPPVPTRLRKAYIASPLAQKCLCRLPRSVVEWAEMSGHLTGEGKFGFKGMLLRSFPRLGTGIFGALGHLGGAHCRSAMKSRHAVISG